MLNWQQLCTDPSLQNLPFKIELNGQGQIIMSPVKVYHSAFQGKLAALLYIHNQQQGEILSECAIQTIEGIKVADVAWVSSQRFTQIKTETACSIAPEICVEVLSSSNTTQEMQTKRLLYFTQHAQEVWLCHENGELEFYNPNGRLPHSTLVPNFPTQI